MLEGARLSAVGQIRNNPNFKNWTCRTVFRGISMIVPVRTYRAD